MQEHSIHGMDSAKESLLQMGMAKAALEYLAAADFIDIDEYTHRSTWDEYATQVTYKGAEIARKLQTRMGRFNLWYRENKDGAFSIIITVAVAAITALITTWICSK